MSQNKIAWSMGHGEFLLATLGTAAVFTDQAALLIDEIT